MIRKYILLKLSLLAFLCFIEINMCAKQVYDVFNNQSIELNYIYKELIPEQAYLKNKVDVKCVQFYPIANKVYASLNKKVFEICTNYLNNEAAYGVLNKEIRQRLTVYQEILESNNSYSSRYENYEKPIIELQSIHCDALSFIANHIFIEVKFSLSSEVSSSYQNINESMSISHYYVVDLESSSISEWKNKLNASQIEILQSKLSPSINETYSLLTSKLKQSEITMLHQEEEHSKVDTSEQLINCKNICERINLQEADYYWHGSGIVICFQNYTQSSKIYNGKGFSLFVPFNDAMYLVNTIPQLAFLKHLKQPVNAQNNFNYWQILTDLSSFRIAPNIQELVGSALNIQHPKSLVMKSYQVFENGKQNYRGQAKYDFTAQGKLLYKAWNDEREKIIQTDYYDYDEANNLVSHTKKNRDDEEVEIYKYDNSKNLVSRKAISNSNITSQEYFYNGNYFYETEYSTFQIHREQEMKQSVFNKQQLCVGDVCYIFNEYGRINGINSTKYIFNQAQIGKDEKGRIIEVHLENDRDNYYFTYDSLNRFVKYEYFQYQNPVIELEYFFESSNLLPYKQVKVSTNYGNHIVELEEYVWEYFK